MPLARARVPLQDRGHLLGDGVFETLRVHGGFPLFSKLHASRLARAVRGLGLPPRVAEDAWAGARRLVTRSKRALGSEFLLRIQVTTGLGDGVVGVPGAYATTAIARPLPSARLEPLRVATWTVGVPGQTPWSAVKTVSFLHHVQARRWAQRRGVHDAVLLNVKGRVAEATTSNVLAVVGDRLHAPGPSEGAVDGVTRRVLLARARRSRIRVDPVLTRGQLKRARELVLTNAVAGIQPVARVDGRALPGKNGPWAQRFQEWHAAAIDADVGARRRLQF